MSLEGAQSTGRIDGTVDVSGNAATSAKMAFLTGKLMKKPTGWGEPSEKSVW